MTTLWTTKLRHNFLDQQRLFVNRRVVKRLYRQNIDRFAAEKNSCLSCCRSSSNISTQKSCCTTICHPDATWRKCHSKQWCSYTCIQLFPVINRCRNRPGTVFFELRLVDNPRFAFVISVVYVTVPEVFPVLATMSPFLVIGRCRSLLATLFSVRRGRKCRICGWNFHAICHNSRVLSISGFGGPVAISGCRMLLQSLANIFLKISMVINPRFALENQLCLS